MNLGRGAVEVQHRELKRVQIGSGTWKVRTIVIPWYWRLGQLRVGVSRGIVGLDCYETLMSSVRAD